MKQSVPHSISRKIILFIYCCLPFTSSLDLVAQTITFKDLPQLQIYVDSTAHITNVALLEKKQSHEWNDIYKKNTDYAYWFKFQLTNSEPTPKMLCLNTSVFDSLTLVSIYDNDTTSTFRGLLVNYSDEEKLSFRNLTANKYGFQISLPSNTQKEFFLRIKNVIRFECEFNNITLETVSKKTNSSTIWFLLFHAFFFGILIFIALFTLIQYFQNKDLAYWYYALYLVLCLFYFWWKFEKANSFLNVLFTEYPNWYYHIEIPMSMTIYICYLHFNIHFINAKKEIPFYYRLLKGTSICLLIYLVLDQMTLHLWGFSWNWEIYFLIRVIVVCFGLFVFYLVIRSKATLAFYLLSGSFVMLIGSAITGYLSKDMTQHYVGSWDVPLLPIQIATLIEIFFFSIGLGYKSRLSDLEKMSIAKNLELEQQEKEYEKQKREQLTHLFTNISHEIRTPLTVIAGISNSIAEHKEATGLIQRNCQNLLGLVNQILSLNKLESSKMEINWEDGDIMEYLHYLGKSFNYLAVNKNQLLETHCNPATYQMTFDKEKMRQITSNLLSNAITYSPNKSIIRLNAFIEKKGEEELFFIQVKDTGIGIPKSSHQQIFESYVQLSHSEGGTGIGLALVKEYVNLLGGQIELDSQVGQGSCFKISFPIPKRKREV